MAATHTVSADWLSDRLHAACGPLTGYLPDPAFEALALYAEQLLGWGKRINLTGATGPEAVADDLIADALYMLPHLPEAPFLGIDVGSGAGLPGVVLAIARPDAHWVLLEPNGKKYAFLASMRRELRDVANLEPQQGRLEPGAASGFAGRFDVAVSRAVWPAADWLERGRPLIKPTGRLLGLRSQGSEGTLPKGVVAVPYELAGRKRAVLVRDAVATDR